MLATYLQMCTNQRETSLQSENFVSGLATSKPASLPVDLLPGYQQALIDNINVCIHNLQF